MRTIRSFIPFVHTQPAMKSPTCEEEPSVVVDVQVEPLIEKEKSSCLLDDNSTAGEEEMEMGESTNMNDNNNNKRLQEEIDRAQLDAQETMKALLDFAEGVRTITKHMQSATTGSSSTSTCDADDNEMDEETKSADDDDKDDCSKNSNSSSSNTLTTRLQMETMISETCLAGTVFGTDLLRLFEQAHHVRDYVRTVHEESSLSAQDVTEAQETAQKAVQRARLAESVARKLFKSNAALQRRVHKLTSEKKVLVQEVKTLREQVVTTRKIEMERLLQQHVVGALLLHEGQLKAMAAARLEKERQRLSYDDEEEEEKVEEDDLELVDAEDCQGQEDKQKHKEEMPIADTAYVVSADGDEEEDVVKEAETSPIADASTKEECSKDEGPKEAPSGESESKTKQESKDTESKTCLPDKSTEHERDSSEASANKEVSETKPTEDQDANKEVHKTPVKSVGLGTALGFGSFSPWSATAKREQKAELNPTVAVVDIDASSGKQAEGAKKNDTSENTKDVAEKPALGFGSFSRWSSTPQKEQKVELKPTVAVDDTDASSGKQAEGATKNDTPDESTEDITEKPAANKENKLTNANQAKKSPAEPPSEQKKKVVTEKKNTASTVSASSSAIKKMGTASLSAAYAPVKLFPNFGRVSPPLPEKPESNRSMSSVESSESQDPSGEAAGGDHVGKKVFNFLFYPEKLHKPQQRGQLPTDENSQKQPPRRQGSAPLVNGKKVTPLLKLHDPAGEADEEKSLDATAPTLAATTPGSSAASRATTLSGTPFRFATEHDNSCQQEIPRIIPNCVSFSEDTLTIHSNLNSPVFHPSPKQATPVRPVCDITKVDSRSPKTSGERDVELYKDLKVFRSLAIPSEEEIDDYNEYQDQQELLCQAASAKEETDQCESGQAGNPVIVDT